MVLDVIKNAFLGEQLPINTFLSSSKPQTSENQKNLRIGIHSPVSIGLFDELNNHTGVSSNSIPDSDLKFIEENVSNSYYLEMGEGKYAGFEETGDEHRVVLQGLDFDILDEEVFAHVLDFFGLRAWGRRQTQNQGVGCLFLIAVYVAFLTTEILTK